MSKKKGNDFVKLVDVANNLNISAHDLISLAKKTHIKIGVYILGWPIEIGYYDYCVDDAEENCPIPILENIKIGDEVLYLQDYDIKRILYCGYAVIHQFNVPKNRFMMIADHDHSLLKGYSIFKKELFPPFYKVENATYRPKVFLADLLLNEDDFLKIQSSMLKQNRPKKILSEDCKKNKRLKKINSFHLEIIKIIKECSPKKISAKTLWDKLKTKINKDTQDNKGMFFKLRCEVKDKDHDNERVDWIDSETNKLKHYTKSTLEKNISQLKAEAIKK